MDDGHWPWKCSTCDQHTVASGESPPLRVAFDSSSGMEHLDVRQVTDVPAGVDETPAQLNLLMAVEQVVKVSADFFVGAPPDCACSTQERCHVATASRAPSAKARYVPPSRFTAFVNQTECNDAQSWVGLECCRNRPVDSGGRHRIIIEKPHDWRVGVTYTHVPAAWDPQVYRTDDFMCVRW